MNKRQYKAKQNPEINPSLLDVHRTVPKTKGGKYVPGNVKVLPPVEHMKEHGIYRERPEQFERLKAIMDERNQMLKTKVAMSNRLLASKRGTDLLDPETIELIESTIKTYSKALKQFEKKVEKHLKKMNLPIIDKMLEIEGVGYIAVGQILRYVDITKADNASSLWKYVGYDKPKYKRYEKGVAGGGNKTLRSALYVMADVFIKLRNSYRDVYDDAKLKYQNSNKLTMTKLAGQKKGEMTEMAWKDVSDGHRHGAAIRKMMKHFLADLWYVWRTLEGLPTRSLYAEEQLGHTGIIRPEERGWSLD